jgi:hypothetical protein
MPRLPHPSIRHPLLLPDATTTSRHGPFATSTWTIRHVDLDHSPRRLGPFATSTRTIRHLDSDHSPPRLGPFGPSTRSIRHVDSVQSPRRLGPLATSTRSSRHVDPAHSGGTLYPRSSHRGANPPERHSRPPSALLSGRVVLEWRRFDGSPSPRSARSSRPHSLNLFTGGRYRVTHGVQRRGDRES